MSRASSRSVSLICSVLKSSESLTSLLSTKVMPTWASTWKASSTPAVATEKMDERLELTPKSAGEPNRTLLSSATAPVVESIVECSLRKDFSAF